MIARPKMVLKGIVLRSVVGQRKSNYGTFRSTRAYTGSNPEKHTLEWRTLRQNSHEEESCTKKGDDSGGACEGGGRRTT